MKNIMIALLLALGVTLSAEGAAGTGNDAVVQLLRSVIIEDYVIYDRMQTFAEVMEDLCIRVDESRKPDQRPVNLVVRSKKYAGREKTPKMRGLEMPSASLYDILVTLEKRKDLLFRISGNVVFVVGPGVPLRNSFSETYGKCRVLNEQLDDIIFPIVNVEGFDIEGMIPFLREYISRFSPDGETVVISHTFTGREMEKMPPVTLNLRNVSLRGVLDCICFVTGCSYYIRPDKIVFFSKRKN